MEQLGLNVRDWSLQTKDFDCAMDVYVLQGGKLHLRKFLVERWVDGDAKSTDLFGRLGHLEREGEYLDPVDFTGTVNMYDYRQDVADQWDCWIEWKATFEKGVIKSIELFKFEKKDNTERKINQANWRREVEEHCNKWYNKYFFHTKLYCAFAHRMRWFLYQTATWIQGLGRFF